jgi:hypothetical protein
VDTAALAELLKFLLQLVVWLVTTGGSGLISAPVAATALILVIAVISLTGAIGATSWALRKALPWAALATFLVLAYREGALDELLQLVIALFGLWLMLRGVGKALMSR